MLMNLNRPLQGSRPIQGNTMIDWMKKRKPQVTGTSMNRSNMMNMLSRPMLGQPMQSQYGMMQRRPMQQGLRRI